nr:branched-chain amino acid ABC transporter ATP-binding protein/permease [uncultured Roseococcus sp.]
MAATDTQGAAASSFGRVLPFLIILALAAAVPLTGNEYWGLIVTRIAVYWILIAGLNLIVGYAGQLAIGYVALFTLGAYTTSVLAAGNATPPVPAFAALAIAGMVGAVFGVVVGLPALRLRTFYFAITTLGFATIVTQIALAWQDVTGGGMGVTGPMLPAPFDTEWGLLYFCLGFAALATWITANIARSRFGRALVAVRDADVAAEATGISKPRLLVMVFILAGALAAMAGGLFAALQTYITPEAFNFELSLLFFIAVLIGGRGSILGPLIGTIILTVLPEIAAPLAAWSTFLYAALLLLIVLAIPGGIASLLDFRNRKPLAAGRTIAPQVDLVRRLGDQAHPPTTLSLREIVLSFGGVRAINGLDLDVRSGEIHGLIGPNGSGKTTTLNVISGYYRPEQGTMALDGAPLPAGVSTDRASRGIARTFQTPRLIGEASVLENVMIGGTAHCHSTFAEALFRLPRHCAEERELAERAQLALRAVGLVGLAEVRADRLQHSELRFMEIARALMQRPAFLLLDEPAAGLSAEEIRHLATLVRAIREGGTGVLLVEHHADLIFDICEHVTVLNLGAILAAGTPAEVRAHKEVVSAYLGA